MSRIALLALLYALFGSLVATPAVAADAAAPEFATPPRLSLVNGPVSLLRPGTATWQSTALNIPLAPGDTLATADRANVEVQVGAHAWLRAANATQFALTANLPDLTVFTLMAGVASVDIRALPSGRMLEIVTPHATVAIRVPGYYRFAISGEAVRLTVRRGGLAQLRSETAREWTVQAGEEVLVQRFDPAVAQLFGAPAEDEWDRWNTSRGDALGSSISARHVSPEVYGLAELDRHGTWRHDGQYGPVWIPSALPQGWTPYGAGRWIDDPVYGQTWLDDAPWGYAPFHYGRWIDLGGTWAWAPGPRLARPAYAPALVGWISDPGVQAGWVALGWGEPVLPWWGPPAFIGRPHWGGWAGPRVINHVVIGSHGSTRDSHAIRYVNSRHATVRPDRDQHAFGARTEFGPTPRGQFSGPRNLSPDDGRARNVAPVAQLPAPTPRAAQAAAPVTPAAIPANAHPAVVPTPPQVNREPRIRATETGSTREQRDRHLDRDAPAHPTPQHVRPALPPPPMQAAGPQPAPAAAAPAGRAALAAPPAAPVAAAPAPAAPHTPAGVQAPGANRHERRADGATPAPRASAPDSGMQGRPARRDESARPGQGGPGPRQDAARPEGAERKPRQ